jgi:hypothetical protein
VHTPVEHFAVLLLRALTAGDYRATHLQARARGKTATIGITDDGVWAPLLRLSALSAAANVMKMEVRQGNAWATIFERGTPAMLAEKLPGPVAITWVIEVNASFD